MELEGLRRGIKHLQDNGCTIKEVVTDRHVQVKKYMREEHGEKAHYFDVWHLAKGTFEVDCIDCQFISARR
jgi:hypothetical protein